MTTTDLLVLIKGNLMLHNLRIKLEINLDYYPIIFAVHTPPNPMFTNFEIYLWHYKIILAVFWTQPNLKCRGAREIFFEPTKVLWKIFFSQSDISLSFVQFFCDRCGCFTLPFYPHIKHENFGNFCCQPRII